MERHDKERANSEDESEDLLGRPLSPEREREREREKEGRGSSQGRAVPPLLEKLLPSRKGIAVALALAALLLLLVALGAGDRYLAESPAAERASESRPALSLLEDACVGRSFSGACKAPLPPIRTLLVNGHAGVAQEISSTFSQLLNLSVDHFHPHLPYTLPREQADRVWEEEPLYRLYCSQYDVILIGDTIPQGRPFFQHIDECPARLVLLLTNRYDLDNFQDEHYRELLHQLSFHRRVLVVQNNLYEEYYARVQSRGFLNVMGYVPSSGVLDLPMVSSFLQEFVEAQPDSPVLSAPESQLFLLDSPSSWVRSLFPAGFFAQEDILLLPKPYGGPLAITNRLLIYLPYQSNTMALFEGLGRNVTFLFPSFSLFSQWGEAGKVFVRENSWRDTLNAVTSQTFDWWRWDLSQKYKIFYYFDSLDDLKKGSKLRQKIAEEHEEHKERIRSFMLQHRIKVRNNWIKLLKAVL